MLERVSWGYLQQVPQGVLHFKRVYFGLLLIPVAVTFLDCCSVTGEHAKLGGGFKCFLFSHLLGEDFHFD